MLVSGGSGATLASHFMGLCSAARMRDFACFCNSIFVAIGVYFEGVVFSAGGGGGEMGFKRFFVEKFYTVCSWKIALTHNSLKNKEFFFWHKNCF